MAKIIDNFTARIRSIFAETPEAPNPTREILLETVTNNGKADSKLVRGQANSIRGLLSYGLSNPDEDLITLTAQRSKSASLDLWCLQSPRLYDLRDEMMRKGEMVYVAWAGTVANVVQRHISFRIDRDEEDERHQEILEFITAECETRMSGWLQSQLFGLYQGFSVSEIVYEEREGGRLGIKTIAHKHPGLFVPMEDGTLRFFSWQVMDVANAAVPSHKFWLTRHGGLYGNPFGDSPLQPVEMLYFLKKSILLAMGDFLDKFGQPLAVATITATDSEMFEEKKKKIKQQMELLSRSNGLIVDSNVKLEFIQRMSGQGVSAFKDSLDYLDRQILLAIRGAVLGVMDSEHNTRAASEVHSGEMNTRTKPLARLAESSFNRDVIDSLIEINFGPEYKGAVILDIDTDEAANIDEKIKALDAATKRVPVPEWFVYDALNVPPPTEDEKTVKDSPPQQPPQFTPPQPTPFSAQAAMCEGPCDCKEKERGVLFHDYITPVGDTAFFNCGIDDGGFTKGNKCAAGGAGGNTEKGAGKKKTGPKSAASRPAPVERKNPVTKAPVKPKTKSEIAKSSHRMVDKEIQRYSEEGNEPVLSKAIGGVPLRNGEPADVLVIRGGKVVHGIELKTMVSNKANKLTMKRDAQERKRKWERQNKAEMHTVVFDDHRVFNAKGKGKHDPSKRDIYYRRGFGSMRVGSMHKVKDMNELKALLDTPNKKLPVSAQRKSAR